MHDQNSINVIVDVKNIHFLNLVGHFWLIPVPSLYDEIIRYAIFFLKT